MIQIQVEYPKARRNPEIRLLMAAISKAAEVVLSNVPDLKQANLTVVVTGDKEIQDLNHRFMELDEPTDVLSFPAREKDPDTGQLYLGDIIISYPRAEAQAAVGKHLVLAEIQLLTVHGLLHLLGYDHLDEAQKKDMWAIQSSVLNQLNNPVVPPA